MEDANLLESLLKCIHTYYPIGIGLLNKNYSGYDKYHEILARKIDSIIKKQSDTWSDCVRAVDSVFNSQVRDLSYFQFPSYQLKVHIQDPSEAGPSTEISLIVTISLLCKYFTFFFIEEYKHTSFVDIVPMPYSRVLYLKSVKGNQSVNSSLIEALNKKIVASFPGYSFLSHKQLMQYTVVGGSNYIDGHELAEPSYNIYQYLFDGFFKTSNSLVLE